MVVFTIARQKDGWQDESAKIIHPKQTKDRKKKEWEKEGKGLST